MASQRKIKVQKQRRARKEKKKEKLREELRKQAEQKRKLSKRRREIKEQLGFDQLLKRIQIPKIESVNPCKEIPLPGFSESGRVLDWNGVEY